MSHVICFNKDKLPLLFSLLPSQLKLDIQARSSPVKLLKRLQEDMLFSESESLLDFILRDDMLLFKKYSY